MLDDWLSSIRPLHWIKSGFCLAALFFGGLADEVGQWLIIFPLLVGFSLLASAGYLANDCINRDEDRQHPRKSRRPIAAGRLKIQWALAMASAFVAFGLGIITWAYYGETHGVCTVGLSVGYLFLTLSYSLVFRSVPIVDVLVLSLGFVVRVAVGAFAIGLIPTWWLLGCTYCVSLMLGFGKRLGEWKLLQKKRQAVGDTRLVLKAYTEDMLRALVGSSCLVACTLYVFYCYSQPERTSLLLTIFPVVTGLTGYLRLAWRSEIVETPEALFFRSPVLSFSVFVWLILVVIVGFQ